MSDSQLFEQVSKGIALIVENGTRLDENARFVSEGKEWRAGEILRAIAREESAKVLILLDVVRCPAGPARTKTLKHFYSHLAKNIYAKACHWRPANFLEVKQAVEDECKAFYLDGPNEIDWVFPNAILSERERLMYVDCVQDVTVQDGEFLWSCPFSYDFGSGTHYQAPAVLDLSRALVQVGMTSPEGLSIVAKVWRDFIPDSRTSHSVIFDMNRATMDRLMEAGLSSAEDPVKRTVADEWPFPLWPVDMAKRGPSQSDLRELRAGRIDLIERVQAQREPAPKIGRDKVETLAALHSAWEEEEEERRGEAEGEGGKKPVFRPAQPIDYGLASLRVLQAEFRRLSEEERIDLLALAWFARDQIGDWPGEYERAREAIRGLSEEYQLLQLGRYWGRGFDRWEQQPHEFEPGQGPRH